MNKIEQFMKDRGKSVKPTKEKKDKEKKDKKKLTGKEKDALLLQMLEDFGYIE